MIRIMHDDWPIRLGENRPDRVLKHLAGILTLPIRNIGSCNLCRLKKEGETSFTTSRSEIWLCGGEAPAQNLWEMAMCFHRVVVAWTAILQ